VGTKFLGGHRPNVITFCFVFHKGPPTRSTTMLGFDESTTTETPSWIDLVAWLSFITVISIQTLYGLVKFLNVIRSLDYVVKTKNQPEKGGKIVEGSEPVVTIQICAYNETKSVLEATIDAACQVKWPQDKLFIQVLDDSTDPKTSQIIESLAASWRRKNVSCNRYSRPDRKGYKAGSLQYHTNKIKGDFVAIFDADHRCAPQFLQRTVRQFFHSDGTDKPEIGLVQTPWAFYNTHQSLLTEHDALSLDVSHAVDQVARYHALGGFGFNGTGGIWRTKAIQDAGGWSGDTLSEDLDISYSAYMAGYRFVYLRDVPQMLEIPSNYMALKEQKRRWIRGVLQVCRKLLIPIWSAPNVPRKFKMEAFFYMTFSAWFLLGFMSLTIVPILYYGKGGFSASQLMSYLLVPYVPISMAAVVAIYTKVAAAHYKTFCSRTYRLIFIPVLVVFYFGASVFSGTAFLEGLLSNDATFHSTPKTGVSDESKDNANNDSKDEANVDDERTTPLLSPSSSDEIDEKTPNKVQSSILASLYDMGLISSGLAIAAALISMMLQETMELLAVENQIGKIILLWLMGSLPISGLCLCHGVALWGAILNSFKKQ